MHSLSKMLIMAGILLILLGGLATLGAKFGPSIGRLPGDVRIEWGDSVFDIPIATSLLLSILLTIVINIVLRVLRK